MLGVVFGLGPFSNDGVQEIDSGPQESIVSQNTEAYTVTVTIPTVQNKQTQAVAQYSISQQNQFVLDAQQAYKQNQDQTEEYPWNQYSLTIDYEKYETAEGYLSYVVNEYLYTGGANGLQLVTSFNYDKNGEKITLGNIVPQENRDALLETLKVRLFSVNNISPEDSGVFADSIRELTFSDLEHFYITDTDLVLAFQEYDVAPGAAGAVRISLPRSSYISLQE